MAFQSGTFTSLSDLLSTIQTFATSNGWSQNGNVLFRAADTAYFEITHTSGTPNYLQITQATNQSGGVLSGDVDTRYKRMSDTAMVTMSFPANYYLFAHTNPSCIFCVINYNTDYCQHMAFGSIRKFGTWTGGAFCSSTSLDETPNFYPPMNYVASDCSDNPPKSSGRFLFPEVTYSFNYTPPHGGTMHCTIDGYVFRHTGWYESPSFEGDAFCGSGWAHNYLRLLNPANLQPVLAPCMIQIQRPGANLSSIIGDIPHVRYLRVDNYEPGDIITIGVDKWMVFPQQIKQGPSYASNSGWGISYDGP